MALTAPIFHNLLTISVMQNSYLCTFTRNIPFSTVLASIPAMVKKAADDGMGAMALTDHGNMFGIKELCTTVKKHNGKVKKQIADAEKASPKLRQPATPTPSPPPRPPWPRPARDM